MQTDPVRINKPVFVICEGGADEQMLERVAAREGITTMQFYDAKGCGKFEEVVRVVKATTGYDQVRRLVLVGDNDADLTRRWRGAKNALVANGFAGPSAPGELTTGSPSTAIYMLPSAVRVGALETLLLDALLEARLDIWRCLDDLFDCVPSAATWTVSRQDKARLMTALAMTIKDPCAGPQYHWRSENRSPILASAKAFDRVAEFLKRAAEF